MTENEIAELLTFVPHEAGRNWWRCVISAVKDAAGNDSIAERLLIAWEPEEIGVSYRRELANCRDAFCRAGWLVAVAKRNGWKAKPSGNDDKIVCVFGNEFPKLCKSGSGMTVGAFCDGKKIRLWISSDAAVAIVPGANVSVSGKWKSEDLFFAIEIERGLR